MTLLQCALKGSWAGLICRTYQYYTASDCQTMSGNNSRRSAWWRDKHWHEFHLSAY